MPCRLHILGASGSGTTTLAANLSDNLKIKHLDTDTYYWKKTVVPFTEKKSAETRLMTIRHDIRHEKNWILSGSICGWGDPLVEYFTHVVYLWIPWKLRKERLLKRELKQYGPEALSPGGNMYQINANFMDWASKYDTAGLEQRSRLTHDKWIEALPEHIQIIRVEEEMPLPMLSQKIMGELNLAC